MPMTNQDAEALLNDPVALEAYLDGVHAANYPDGCRVAGHHCMRCSTRLGDDAPHRYVKVGARRGYRGTWVCDEPKCPYYRS